MIELFNPDSLVKKFCTIEITKEMYNYLSKQTNAFPFVCSSKWTSKLSSSDDNYKLITFATGMRIVEKQIDIDTKIAKVKLRFYNGIEESEKLFDSAILTSFGAKDLFTYGIRFDFDSIDLVTDYLIRSESSAPIRMTYSKLGWDYEKKIFKSYVAFDANGKINNLSYNGNLDSTPSGSLDDWLSMVEHEVLPSIPMTIAMLLGFASPVLEYVNNVYSIGSIMFNLSNYSSKGKSTAGMLAASVFSNPTLNRGNMISFNATENALIQFLSDLQGHTVVIDEVAVSNSSDFTRLMYTICSGRSKMRLNGDTSQKEVKEFSSIVITTAEFGLIQPDTPNGIKTRVFEIQDTLTLSSKNSDAIKQCIIRNYGVAGEKFIKYLINNCDSIVTDYEKDKKILTGKCPSKRDLTDRICSKLAIILTTARYVNTALDLSIDLDRIIEYLVRLQTNIDTDTKPDERLLEIIRQEVTKNNSKYITESYSPSTQCVGAIKSHKGYSEIQITELEFHRIMASLKITSWQSSLKKLKENGVLQTESDRLYKRVVLIKEIGRQKCYCFRIDNDIDNVRIPSVEDPELDLFSDLITLE